MKISGHSVRNRHSWRWRVRFIMLASGVLTLAPRIGFPQSAASADGGPAGPFLAADIVTSSSADRQRTGPSALTAALQTAPASPAARDQETPRTQTVTAGWNDGFVIQSATGDHRLQVGLLVQADGRFALDDEDSEAVDTFALRRVRPYLRGRVAQRFEFYLNPDFANGTPVVQDAYVDTRFSPAFVVRLGKGKTPFGLERLMSASSLLFMERALPTAIVPNRDIGVQVLGDLPGGFLSYAAGVLNGVADGGSADLDTNDGKDLAGRLAVRPFGAASSRPLSGLTLAIAGTTGNQAGPLATIRTSSQLQIFLTYIGATADGRVNRYSPQASYFFGRAAGLAEYVHTSVPVRKGQLRETVAHDAWQVAGSFVLTGGDTASEQGVRPQHNFDFGHGHLGALQLAARYHTLVADEDAIALGLAVTGSSREARAWTLGLNWYLNPALKYIVNFERTEFDGDEAPARHAENALSFRAQVNF